MLKALIFFKEFIRGAYPKNKDEFNQITFQQKGVGDHISRLTPVAFTFRFNGGHLFWIYQLEIYGYEFNDGQMACSELLGVAEKEIKKDFTLRDISYVNEHFYEYEICVLNNLYISPIQDSPKSPIQAERNWQHFSRKKKGSYLEHNTSGIGCVIKRSALGGIDIFINDMLRNLKVYRPDINKMKLPNPITNSLDLNQDASNLASFFFNLSQNQSDEFQQLEDDLRKCVKEVTRLRTPGARGQNGFVEIKVFDITGGYWADETSEGILYFLALLAIAYQPDPPSMLLLEEPETGIHPKRMAEILDFIYRLVENKKIQVIMTSHSPVLVDKFSDSPENVFVFEKDKEGATIVKNLLNDIIIPSDKKLGKEKIDYTESLGEHWTMGFLGGVPK
ncbi:MAG: AAA family ATPase [Bacteroidota bacterium]